MRQLPNLFFRAPDEGAGAGPADPKATTDDTVKALEAATAARLAAEARVAALEKAQAERDAAEAAKRGEFEGLYKTTKQQADELAAKLKAHEERETARVADLDKANKARIKEIPEARRGLVPDGLDAVALDAYLTRNMPALKGDEPAAGTRSAKGGPGPDDDEAIRKAFPDVAADADRRGVGPKFWYDILIKSGQIKPAAQA